MVIRAIALAQRPPVERSVGFRQIRDPSPVTGRAEVEDQAAINLVASGSGVEPVQLPGEAADLGADTLNITPVCLNTLLYRLELDLSEIDSVLHRDNDAARWRDLARQRHARIAA